MKGLVEGMVAAGFLVTSVRAQVIPVSGGGGALAAAIAAAPNDAVLVVAPGTYSIVALGVNKNVTIVAPQGATVDERLQIGFGGPYRLTVVGLSIMPSLLHPGALGTNGSLFAEGCSGGVIQLGGTSVVPVCMRNCSFGYAAQNTMQNVDAVLLDSTFLGRTDAGQFGFPGLIVTGSGSMRAERTSMLGYGATFTSGDGLQISTPAVFADCVLSGGSGAYQAAAVVSTSTVTLSNCTVTGSVSPAPTLRTVPSATFVNQAWTVGGSSQLRCHASANRVVALIAATDVVPWSSPFASEPLYVGATPNWLVSSLGVTDGSGDLVAAFALPGAAALQYQSVWLTCAVVDALPIATSCPLGGIVR